MNLYWRSAASWTSGICACRADWAANQERASYRACCEEHESWCLIVGSQEVRKKRRYVTEAVEKAVKSGVPGSFQKTLRRFERGDGTFHRPPELPANPEALGADAGFYLFETFGVELTACAEPSRYATLRANKAARGLLEKMWREDYFGEGMRGENRTMFPEELVADGLLDAGEAEQMFECTLQPDLVAAFASWGARK